VSFTAIGFGSIDPGTGAYTLINDAAGLNWPGLAADPGTGLFYAVDLATAGSPLVSITPGGEVTYIGATGLNIRGLAFDPGTATLYGATPSELFRINIADGTATLVGLMFLNFDFNFRLGLAFGNGTLYMNFGDGLRGNSLYSLNTANGLAALIGANGATAGDGIDGLAFVPDAAVPEPSTFLLLGVGVASLAIARSRAR
jgi:hypothetical protein